MGVLAISAQNGIWKNETILTTHSSKEDFFPLLSVQVTWESHFLFLAHL